MVIKLLEGTMHPAYSLTCMDEERDFRDKYWRVLAGDEVVDVGASYGAYTLTALEAGAAMVWAFEPEPSIAADLRRNIEANGWSERAHVFAEALSDKTEALDMRSYAPHWPQQCITGTYAARALDDVATLMSRLDWLKVDVEGAEERVLRGALETLKRCRPTVIVECHTFLRQGITDSCRELLQQAGYAKFEVVARPPCQMLLAYPRGAKK
jgi:FkbM family methyltransferase